MDVIKPAVAIGSLAISAVVFADKLEPDDLPGPQPEVAKHPANVETPAIPAFALPAIDPGFHAPRELRVRGKPLLGTEIKVKGYITWIYDCPAVLAQANPDATRAQILLAINKDPSLCERPKFYLGDAKDTSRDRSIWVVDVPRAPTKQERDRLPKDELKAWPAVPKLALGDHVVVTGTWGVRSPHAEHNTDGLLIYSALDRAAPGAAAAPPPSPASEPEVAVVTKPPLRKAIDERTRNASVDRLNACNKAMLARQFDVAITECEAATKAWAGNHLAWYARASAYMARNEWPQATAAIERAVTMRPDVGMYQLYHGISLYEAEHQRAREEQARRDHLKPEELTLDPSLLRLEPAIAALRRAARLGPELWRAHYYLGRAYRDVDDARRAAEQFTQTIKTHPAYRFGYIALSELYRRWDYADESLAIASLGAASVPAGEAAELWFEVGMAHDAKHADDKAIEAFGKAIAIKPDDASSKFQRGQIYYRKNDLASARADLEDVMKSADPRLAHAKPIAKQVLSQIASKQH